VKLRRLAPILLFAAVLFLMQWVSGRGLTALPFVTIAVFLVVALLGRLIPWQSLAARVRPGSQFFSLVLFLHITHHFVRILGQETVRVLQARRLCIRRRWGPGAFRSLAWALAGVFRRSMVRAERFYAAQMLRGLGE
jgi:hypothetical protein